MSIQKDGKAPMDPNVEQIFTSESLADGIYEDSLVVIHSFSGKTFTIKNLTDPVTGVDLKYKIWGSADNSEFEEIIPETLLIKGAKISVMNNNYWGFTKISAKGSGGISTVTAFVQEGV